MGGSDAAFWSAPARSLRRDGARGGQCGQSGVAPAEPRFPPHSKSGQDAASTSRTPAPDQKPTAFTPNPKKASMFKNKRICNKPSIARTFVYLFIKCCGVLFFINIRASV